MSIINVFEDRWMTEKEIADYLGMTKATVSYKVHNSHGKFPANIVGKTYRIKRSKIEAWKTGELYIPQFPRDENGAEIPMNEVEAAQYLGVSERMLKQWIQQTDIPCICVNTAGSAQPEEDGVQPEEDGAQPEEDGAQPEEDGVQSEEDGVQSEEDGVQPVIFMRSVLDAWITSGRSNMRYRSPYFQYVMQDAWVTIAQLAKMNNVPTERFRILQRKTDAPFYRVYRTYRTKMSEMTAWADAHDYKLAKVEHDEEIHADQVEKHLLTFREAAKYMDVSVDGLKAWVIDGLIPARKVNHQWHFDVDELDQWIRSFAEHTER